MKFQWLLLLLGVALIILKWKRFILIETWWIVLCFALWFVLTYISIHRKNKDLRTPRPVYLTR